MDPSGALSPEQMIKGYLGVRANEKKPFFFTKGSALITGPCPDTKDLPVMSKEQKQTIEAVIRRLNSYESLETLTLSDRVDSQFCVYMDRLNTPLEEKILAVFLSRIQKETERIHRDIFSKLLMAHVKSYYNPHIKLTLPLQMMSKSEDSQHIHSPSSDSGRRRPSVGSPRKLFSRESSPSKDNRKSSPKSLEINQAYIQALTLNGLDMLREYWVNSLRPSSHEMEFQSTADRMLVQAHKLESPPQMSFVICQSILSYLKIGRPSTELFGIDIYRHLGLISIDCHQERFLEKQLSENFDHEKVFRNLIDKLVQGLNLSEKLNKKVLKRWDQCTGANRDNFTYAVAAFLKKIQILDDDEYKIYELLLMTRQSIYMPFVRPIEQILKFQGNPFTLRLENIEYCFNDKKCTVTLMGKGYPDDKDFPSSRAEYSICLCKELKKDWTCKLDLFFALSPGCQEFFNKLSELLKKVGFINMRHGFYTQDCFS